MTSLTVTLLQPQPQPAVTHPPGTCQTGPAVEPCALAAANHYCTAPEASSHQPARSFLPILCKLTGPVPAAAGLVPPVIVCCCDLWVHPVPLTKWGESSACSSAKDPAAEQQAWFCERCRQCNNSSHSPAVVQVWCVFFPNAMQLLAVVIRTDYSASVSRTLPQHNHECPCRVLATCHRCACALAHEAPLLLCSWPQAWAILGASVGLVTHTLEFKDMFAAANNTVVWLVVISFFLAKVRPFYTCHATVLQPLLALLASFHFIWSGPDLPPPPNTHTSPLPRPGRHLSHNCFGVAVAWRGTVAATRFIEYQVC